MPDNVLRFAQLIELHINKVIKSRFTMEALTPALMREIRDEIRKQIDTVFQKSSHKLTDHARSWLTDQFFKRIQVNGDQLMSDLVVINEYRLDQLTYEDVQLMRNLFDETGLAGDLNEEYARRSAS
jgi:hypothetical protein